MIYLTGDTHGDVDGSKLWLRDFEKDDVVIVLGDFGFIWRNKRCGLLRDLENLNEVVNCMGCTLLWLDGNHENFDQINTFPVVDLYGGKAHKIFDNCYHLMRGEVYNIEGKSFLTIGGAYSIDRPYRTEGESWWAQEEITKEDIEKSLRVKEVDYILSHCAPMNMTKLIELHIPYFNPYYYNPYISEKFLQVVMDKVKYKKWFCGHYHIDKDFGDFCVLYNTFYNLNEGKMSYDTQS